MDSSLSFDRAASYYDQTRPLPEPVARQGVDAILEITGSPARLLDVGTGTGRVSIPLLERGADLVGCDLSVPMLKRLQEKRPAARILQADAARLPFPAASFDAVLTVHVIHLIAAWREAVREFQRLAGPGGLYLNVRTYADVGNSVRGQLRKFWRGWVEGHGARIYQPGVQDYQEFLHELGLLGATLHEVEVVRFSLPFTLRQELERFTSRVYSDSWHVPDDVYEASMKELQSWVLKEYGNLDLVRQDEVRFVIDVAKWNGESGDKG